MAEIIGENMSSVFDWLGIAPTKTFTGDIGSWHNFEVWELSADELCCLIDNFNADANDEAWNSIEPEDKWWRYAEGSNQGVPQNEVVIKDTTIRAWINPYRRDWLEIEFEELPLEDKIEYSGFEDYCNVWMPTNYENLMAYFHDEFHVGSEGNICALVTDLAAYNDMSIADIFRIYS